MAEVIWKWVEGYEDLYEVSSTGELKSYRKKAPYIMKKPIMTSGYYYITVSVEKRRKNLSVHREVAKAFIPNPEGKREVNHIDGNKLNNHVSNLEWNTPKENIQHAKKAGVKFGKRKWSAEQVDAVRYMYGSGRSMVEISEDLGIPEGTIWHMTKGKTWK